jgi:signal transduction histidine kinase
MGNNHTKIHGITTLALILLSVAAELIYFSDFEYSYRTRMFNRILSEKEKIVEDCLNDMKPILAGDDGHTLVSANNLFAVAEENRIAILEYIDNKLVYWSDNEFDVPLYLNDSLFSKPLIFLQNGWFLSKSIHAGNEKIIGLLRIHTDYGFENDIIKSGFVNEFRMSQNVGFSSDKSASEFHVNNNNGDFLFSLIFPEQRDITYLIFVPLSLWIFAFIMLVLLSLDVVKLMVGRGSPRLGTGLVVLIFFIVYLLILKTEKPSVFFQTELFSPLRYSLNNVIPSLGHLFIISILSACVSYVFFRHYPLSDFKAREKWQQYLSLFILISFAAFLFCWSNIFFSRLILNSNINFETYKVQEISFFSVIAFGSVILVVFVPLFLLMKIFKTIYHFNKRAVVLLIFSSLIVIFPFLSNNPDIFLPFILFYLAITLSVWITVNRGTGVFNQAVVFSLIFGVYSLYLISVLSEEKSIENLKIQAVSFSTENDPEAEHLLLDMWPEITNDSVLADMMEVEYFNNVDFNRISNYLQQRYFTGYWRNFNLNIVPCRNDESIQIGPGDDVNENCFGFFDERIRRFGHVLTGTDFYFIDNQAGRSFYMGRLFFKTTSGTVTGLFIDLYSDVNMFQPGYSELLLDKKYHGYAGLKDYSFAKYINGDIVLRTGEFPYSNTDAEYIDEKEEYRIFVDDDYKHVLYKSGNSTVLISKPLLNFGDIIVSFAYLFAFILLFLNLMIFVIRRPDLRFILNFNFRQKLQLSFIGVLFFSFILIGIVVSFYSVNQYKTKHSENLKEKLSSVYLELESVLSGEQHLGTGWRSPDYLSLNDLLIRLSNVFMTDINLYDLNGYLIATSRPEIFFRDLTSRRINNMAFTNLNNLTKTEYFQTEKIGSLQYISAYVPFYNDENKVIAYLNLPYFRMQSVLAREISTLIVAVINFTLLLIVITMSLAVFISGRLTAPLTMLSDGLASVGVGKKSEHLSYKGHDEIGELVKQYNRMVDEIEESTEKLANSERESAWREMAKQIAHEIKNPLTPMKLNVQQLFKSWNDKVSDFDKRLERFTKNQIEYIDNLSSIASAFSSFAKMPVTNPMEVDLLEQIKMTLELFKDTDNITFRVRWPRESKIIIYADKEHINGVFSNLIKNGIQSVPQGRKGLIDVNMEVRSDKVTVLISDNGTGIPEELQKKMFTPNFTTKSSGMGLGLSIVKRYVENANGKIWFESIADQGTVFYVEIPLKYTVEKLG